MTARIQIVGRLPEELSRRVRAVAKQRKVSLNTFLIDALTSALPTDAVRHAPRSQKVIASKETT
jgi:hypothetical protein